MRRFAVCLPLLFTQLAVLWSAPVPPPRKSPVRPGSPVGRWRIVRTDAKRPPGTMELLADGRAGYCGVQGGSSVAARWVLNETEDGTDFLLTQGRGDDAVVLESGRWEDGRLKMPGGWTLRFDSRGCRKVCWRREPRVAAVLRAGCGLKQTNKQTRRRSCTKRLRNTI